MSKNLFLKTIISFTFLIIPLVGYAQATDLFVLPGSDTTNPGNHPRVNVTAGVGHVFDVLSKNPIGSEVTISYTYENSGSHGFLHSMQSSHTLSLGDMRSFSITSRLGMYTATDLGVTSIVGNTIQNRLYNGESLGITVKLAHRVSLWTQASYNKVETLPYYSNFNIGYVYSF